MKRVGFEYQQERGATPFETFLRYTDEKERSSVVLGRLLKRPLRKEGMSLLDVGAGNGEYVHRALAYVRIPNGTKLILLEPSKSLVRQLRVMARRFPVNLAVYVRQSTLEEYDPRAQFDIILASHLPFSKDRLRSTYAKMLAWLRPGGSIVIVLRKRDDVHDFRTKYKSRLLKVNYTSLTLEDAESVLIELGGIVPLRISTYQAEATLHIPVSTKLRDAKTIVEFLLNARWGNLPQGIRRDVMRHLKSRNGQLHIIDGFIVVKKLQS